MPARVPILENTQGSTVSEMDVAFGGRHAEGILLQEGKSFGSGPEDRVYEGRTGGLPRGAVRAQRTARGMGD
ncbi:MAG: hypothetical protein WBW47_06885 [Thermoplasmata archaeon]